MTKCLYIGIKNIIGGSELINDKIKGRSANHLCALSRPQELTPIKPIANFERTLSKPKFFKSRPKADTGPQLLGICFGVGLFLVGIIYIYIYICKHNWKGTLLRDRGSQRIHENPSSLPQCCKLDSDLHKEKEMSVVIKQSKYQYCQEPSLRRRL